MSFRAQCSFCGRQIKVRDQALGASVRCPQCDNHFTAAPLDEPAPPEALARFRLPRAPITTPPQAAAPVDAAPDRPAVAQAVMALPANPALAALETGEATPDLVSELPPEADAATTRAFGARVHVVGVMALLLAGAALTCASLPAATHLTIPLAALGLLAGLAAVALCLGAARPALFFPIGATMASAALLVIAWVFPQLLGPTYERAAAPTQPALITVIPLSPKDSPADLAPDGWADASRAALQQGPLRITVVAVSIGPVKLRGERLAWTKADYLAIRLRIQHIGSVRDLVYERPREGTRSENAPRLTDALGIPVGPAGPEARSPKAGQVLRKSLFPGNIFEDVLVFQPQRRVDFLRLELPAGAWGGAGVLRFTIPASMIREAAAPEGEERL